MTQTKTCAIFLTVNIQLSRKLKELVLFRLYEFGVSQKVSKNRDNSIENEDQKAIFMNGTEK